MTRPVAALLLTLALQIPCAAMAQDSLATAPPTSDSATTPPDSSVDAALEESRGLLRDGDYDHAIETLKAALPRARARHEGLQEVTLQLIKTYVFLGNDLKFKPQGREASSLNYQEARRLIAECLKTRTLRHTRPVPESSYPPEMVTFFAEARRELFGSFRVPDVKPATAVVMLDGDTLRALTTLTAMSGARDSLRLRNPLAPAPTMAPRGDVDIAVGPHTVVVRARGFKDLTERVTVSPGATLERSYRLTQRHGPMWYTLRGAGVAGLIGGITALRGNHTTPSTQAAEALPGAPPPPATP